MANRQGFSAMSEDKARQIQSMGGRNSPTKFKKGDQRTKDAGRRGGKISRRT